MMSNRENHATDDGQSEIDRGLPSINKNATPKGGIGQKIILSIVATIVIISLIAVNGGFRTKDEDSDKETNAKKDDIGNRLGPAPELPPPPLPPKKVEKEQQPKPEIIKTKQLAPPAPLYTPVNKKEPPTPAQRKTSSTLLAFGNVSQSDAKQRQRTPEEIAQEQVRKQTGGNGRSNLLNNKTERADGLGAKLEPTSVQGARASIIADRNMFITKGTFLDCALETAISSDVPGMTSCRVTRDIYSTSGKVLLLERGSRITGQYKGGLERGQARIFVLWTRVETPNGVIVNLDSPGTDGLGRSGHEGFIDSQFWKRFGGAIMLSLIDDVGTWVANEASDSNGGNNQIQFGNTTEAAKNASGIALENSINIPPRLVKHHGDHINVFVARDLDFRGVYDLKVKN